MWQVCTGAMQAYGGEQQNVYGTLTNLTTEMGGFKSATDGATGAMQNLSSAISDAADEQARLNSERAASHPDKSWDSPKGKDKSTIGRHHTGTPGIKRNSPKDFEELYEKITDDKIKKNEVLTILEEGESVIANRDKKKWINTFDMLLQTAQLSPNALAHPAPSIPGASPVLRSFTPSSPNIPFSPQIKQGDIIVHGNVDKSTLPVLSEILQKSCDYTLGQINKNRKLAFGNR